MLGVATSTVAGRLRITVRSGVGCQTSITASQISTANGSSVPVKVSGEYSKRQSVCGCSAAHSTKRRAPSTAMATIPALSLP